MNYREQMLSSALAKSGLLTSDTMDEVEKLLSRIDKSDVETVRVLFTDQHGILRGKTIVASALPSLFTTGMAVPSTLLLKDTSHRTVFPVWSGDAGVGSGPMNGASDILLLPDPLTFKILPWSPHSAWILCDTVFKNGEAIPFDSRTILKSALTGLAKHKLSLIVGLEVEFHVYELVDRNLTHDDATMPGHPPATRPMAQGYQLLTENRYGELEEVMDELRRCAQQLGLPVRSMEVEMGPSQFEFTFEPDTPLVHADNLVMFRTMVKEVCARRALHATFMCRPKVNNGAASGLHLHQSLIRADTGNNLFMPENEGELTTLASQWIAGLLVNARESCLLTTPTVNGYKRYKPFQLAPDRIQWGNDNRGAMVRGLMYPGNSASRIENRVAETTANPYLFFTSQIISGLDGVQRELVAPPAVETPYSSDAQYLPKSLIAAIQAFENSTLYRSQLGDEFVDYLTHIKKAEWDRYLMTVSEWEQAEYFSIF